MTRWGVRKNADEPSRRRQRAFAAGDPALLDRVVVDKLRSGRADQLTLHELQHASPGLVPPEVFARVFGLSLERLAAMDDRESRRRGALVQTAFDALVRGLRRISQVLWDRYQMVQVETAGADVSIYPSHQSEERPRLVVDVNTAELDPGLVYPGPHGIPALRFYANEDSIETNEDGGWSNE